MSERRVRMQRQLNGTAERATLEGGHPLGWQAAAIGEYQQSLSVRIADLRAQLAARILVRTCTYCSTGQVESSKISSLSDLGYALSAWSPLHEDCEDYSAEDLADF